MSKRDDALVRAVKCAVVRLSVNPVGCTESGYEAICLEVADDLMKALENRKKSKRGRSDDQAAMQRN